MKVNIKSPRININRKNEKEREVTNDHIMKQYVMKDSNIIPHELNRKIKRTLRMDSDLDNIIRYEIESLI